MTPLVDRRPDYDELLRLAEQATPVQPAEGEPRGALWPWADDGIWFWHEMEIHAHAAFCAAASPDVVAALIRENRQQAERIAALEEAGMTALRGFHLAQYDDHRHRVEDCPTRSFQELVASLKGSRP